MVELGGGLSSIIIIAEALVIWRLWQRQLMLTDRALLREQELTKDYIKQAQLIQSIVQSLGQK
jgi:hypothetical protein